MFLVEQAVDDTVGIRGERGEIHVRAVDALKLIVHSLCLGEQGTSVIQQHITQSGKFILLRFGFDALSCR